jgi:hypothetical protein
MVESDPNSATQSAIERLLGRPERQRWAACAAIWTRLYVASAPGWTKWPHLEPTATLALSLALRRAAGVAVQGSDELLRALQAFDVEDDSSEEWQTVIDLFELLSGVLKQSYVDMCLKQAVVTYLDGAFNTAAIKLSQQKSRPVSQQETLEALGKLGVWKQAESFVLNL